MEPESKDKEHQRITGANGKALFVLVPVDEYDALTQTAEAARELRRAGAALSDRLGGADGVPASVAHRIADGENPIRVWREARGLKAVALARAAGISPAYLSEIETGKKDGTFRTVAAIARVLNVSLDDLAPLADDDGRKARERSALVEGVRAQVRMLVDLVTGPADFNTAAVRRAVTTLAGDAVALKANGGEPWLASKSVRVRAVLDLVLARAGVVGVMAYSPWEALWLASSGVADILVGYPTADQAALDAIAADEGAAAAVTLMVDDVAQAARASRAAAAHGRTLRVCLDVDASLRLALGPLALHLGVRRSPVHTPAEVAALAGSVARLPGLRVRGLMFYEAQVAGLPDSSAAVRAVKRLSLADLDVRRRAVRDAVQREVGPLALVNGGGTGSVDRTAADPTVTEVTAGSGLYGPTLFDGYRAFRPRPAAFVGLDVVRLPGPGYATVFGGGYVASGPAAPSRLPRPAWPAGLRLTGREGAGEVQTPLRLAAGRVLSVGDRVWFRHAKAGEVMERFADVHLVRRGRVERAVPTYRGEGRSFG
jgi:D-serine deaminase-like pyridoxal phosphate-dependent protein/DNA-binding XRE family transcriptional regulator